LELVLNITAVNRLMVVPNTRFTAVIEVYAII